MSLHLLKSSIERKKSTALGIGPMSINCVDAVCELSNEYNLPLMLIASRRQIDSKELGGGYVNNWSTEEFSNYVMANDPKKLVILSRDHGGPWQNNFELENKYNLEEAMASAKKSYSVDIASGFKIIHIDPSIDPFHEINTDLVLERIYELYDFCFQEAERYNKEIIFEIGTEEQSGSTNTPEELEYTVEKIKIFCEKNKFPKPSFVVIQSGTRVVEMRNVGSFDSDIRVKNELASEIQVPRMIEICEKNGIWMKAHNTDYVSNEGLKSHPKLGIHAVNIAPEFGVIETRALIEAFTHSAMYKERDDFLDMSYNSRKWEKWMVNDTKASDFDRSVISGHYVFSKKECVELIDRLSFELAKREINLHAYLREKVKQGIMRYVKNLNLA